MNTACMDLDFYKIYEKYMSDIFIVVGYDNNKIKRDTILS